MKMDYILLIFLVYVNIQYGEIGASFLSHSTSHVQMMSSELRIIYSNSTANWMNGLEFCGSENARMIKEEDLKGTLNEYIKPSDGYIWLGSYKARTKYITDLGCFGLKKEDVSRSITNITKKGMTIPHCFFNCIKQSNVTINLFLLRGITCLCVQDADILQDRNIELGCLNLCAEKKGICGGNETYSAYKIEHELAVDRTKGFCRQIKNPFNESYAVGCSENNRFVCKEKHTDDADIQYLQSSGELPWETARDICKAKFSLGSRYSQVELKDFLEGRIPDIDQDNEYWLSTRVYTTDLTVTDTFNMAEWNYLYECDVWNKATRKLSQIACHKKNKVICIRDIPTTLSTVSQPTDPSMTYSGMTGDNSIQITNLDNLQTHRNKDGRNVSAYNPTNGNHFYMSLIVLCTFLGFICILLA